jgi:hypothetical protein
VTIKRPQNYNAYSRPALQELAAGFQDASWDDNVAVVVFTGTGDRSFCTGGDVKEDQESYTQRPRDYWKYMCCFKAYMESIVNCSKPVIARRTMSACDAGRGTRTGRASPFGVRTRRRARSVKLRAYRRCLTTAASAGRRSGIDDCGLQTH